MATAGIAPLQAAASLAYIGLEAEALRHALEVLERSDLLATFYPSPVQLVQDARRWQAVQRKGHEVGNNSLHGVSVRGGLHNWTLAMVGADIEETGRLIKELFPDQLEHSFSFPGPDTICLQTQESPIEVSYESLINENFKVTIGGSPGLNPLDGTLQGLRTTLLRDPDDALHAANEALESGSWIIFRIEDTDVTIAHDRVCQWLSERSEQVLTAPVIQVASRLSSKAVTKR